MKYGFAILWFLIASCGLHAHNACKSCADLQFIQNKGQWPKHILFKAEKPGVTFIAEKDGFSYQFKDEVKMAQIIQYYHRGDVPKPIDDNVLHHRVKVELVEPNETPQIVGGQPFNSSFNYFLGKDTTQWASNVKAYRNVFYHNIYPNIDLKLYSQNGQFKYDFIIKPDGNIQDIKLNLQGADAIYIDEAGDLIVETALADYKELKPYTYYQNSKASIPMQYSKQKNWIQFSTATEVNWTETVIIDPQMVFSSYSGSTANNFGYTATYDNAGNLYSGSSILAGGGSYPTSPGAFQVSYRGGATDIGLSKFSADGSTLVYSTYLGGESGELPHSIVVNDDNELYVLGTTSSNQFPTTNNAYNTNYNGGVSEYGNDIILSGYENGADIFITGLSADGRSLVGSTYLGGSNNDGINAPDGTLSPNYADELRGEIQIDRNGNVVIASMTSSSNFPTTAGAYQTTKSVAQDAIIVKMNPNLSTLLNSTFVGGNGLDALYSIDFTSTGDIVAAGGTRSNNLQTSSNAIATAQGGEDGYIIVLDPSLQNFRKATYYGSSAYDQVYFADVNKEDEIYLYGQTMAASNQLIQNAAYNQSRGGQFIARLDAELENIVFSTRFGRTANGDGDPDISPTAFLVDFCNRIYISGWGGTVNASGSDPFNFNFTTSGLPVTSDALVSSTDGSDFYLMALKADASDIDYATFFGGNASDDHVDGGTSRFDKQGIVYQAMCASCREATSDIPIFPNRNAVVSPNDNSGLGCNLAVFKMDFEADLIVAGAGFDVSTCTGLTLDFNNQSSTFSASPSYAWDFGDGNSSTQQNPTHTYQQGGTYQVKLVVTDPLACNGVDSVIQEIVVSNNDVETLPDTTVCPGQPVELGFETEFVPGITYRWVPSADVVSPNSSITAVFAQQSTTYRLIKDIDNGACADTFIQQVNISLVDIPIVGPDTLCTDETSTLVADDFNGLLSNFEWNDGTLGPQLDIIGDVTRTYTVTAIDTLGCEQTQDKLVELAPEVIINIISNTPEICSGDSAALVGNTNFSSPDFQYNWTPKSSVIGAGNGPQVTVNPTSTTTYVLTITTNQGCVYQDSITIIANPAGNTTLPKVDVCFGESQIIGTAPMANNTYEWLPTRFLNDPTRANPTVTPTETTEYTLLTKSEFCVDTTTILVNVPQEDLDIVGLDTICTQDTTQVVSSFNSDPSVLNFEWTPQDSAIGRTDTSSVTVSPNTSIFFYLTITDTVGCVYKDSATILFGRPLDISIAADRTEICAGDTIQLTATNNDALTSPTFNWTPKDDLLDPNNQNPQAAPTDTTNFQLRAVSDEGCPFEGVIPVNARETVIETLPLITHCIRDTIEIGINRNNDPAQQYSWSPVFGLSHPDSNLTSAQPQDSTTYTLLRAGSLCVDTFTQTIRVINDTVKTIGDTINCFGEEIHLLATNQGANKLSYTWLPDSLISGTNGDTTLANAIDTTTFIVQATDAFGCFYSDSVTIPVVTIDIDVQLDRAETCFGDEVTATVINNNNYNLSYDWQPKSQINGADNTSSIQINANQSNQIIVTASHVSGCTLNDSIFLTVRDHLSINLDTAEICDQLSTTIGPDSVLTPGIVTFDWTPIEGLSGISIQNPTAAPNTTTNYQLLVSSDFCRDTFKQTLVVFDNDLNIEGTLEICKNTSYPITAQLENPDRLGTINWQPENVLQFTEGTLQNRLNTNTNVWVSADVTTLLGCRYSDSVRFDVVNEQFDIFLEASVDSVRRNDTFQLFAKANQLNVDFNWSPILKVTDPDSADTRAFMDTVTTFIVEGTDKFNCRLKDSITISIFEPGCSLPYVYLPNAFTPNDDGLNDVLLLRGSDVETMHLMIYDRWGQKVFESFDPNVGWNGTWNGEKLAPSVFAYYLKVVCFDGTSNESKGNVTLIK